MKNSKRSFKWPLIAVPVMAVLLLAVLSVWQFAPNSSPGVVQKTLEPLTAKQVFAAARSDRNIPVQLKANQVYHQESLRVVYIYGCYPTKEYVDTYTNKQGNLVRTIRSNEDKKIIEAVNFTDDQKPKDEPYFDQSAVKMPPSQAEQECPPAKYLSEEDTMKYQMHIEAIARAYGLESQDEKPLMYSGNTYMQDLMSGSIVRQAESFKKLETINEWTVNRNVERPDMFPKPVIELTYQVGHVFEKLYFSESKKAFMGYEVRDPDSVAYRNEIVLGQGVVNISDMR
ncbi:MAG: hypothetical protein ABIQ64_02095 [Candidatus Saccharimonadales bacterium]